MALTVMGALLSITPCAAAALPQLFGTVEFRAESLAALPQWQRTLRQIEQERPLYRSCWNAEPSCPSRGAAAWQSMLKAQVGRPRFHQIQAVNRFLNDWQYRSDQENYGRRDYWATPLEFVRRSGDCEDYAIIKYVSLRELGFGADQLRLVVLNDVSRGLAHAVLAVYLDQEVYILDNLYRAVLPQEQIAQYVPYYSINETTRWAHVAPAEPLLSAAPARQASVPAAR
jgi:predicted transglutaminase-like cysteine proteinase